LALGVNVKVFDNNIHKLKRLQKTLPSQVFTSTIQERVLTKSLMRCDVAIGAVKGYNRSPILVSEEMVQRMKPGSVIIDVCIDRKSTRLNSSHVKISYAVFCLKKKNNYSQHPNNYHDQSQTYHKKHYC